jgi:hypothetical protein
MERGVDGGPPLLSWSKITTGPYGPSRDYPVM